MSWVEKNRILPHLLTGLGILSLTAIATRPMWSTTRWVLAGDALAHLFRAFALDRALRQGIIYPRWLPDLAFGYGYPNLNFYPPLTAYIAETLHLLGWWYADAIKIEFILAFCIAAWGAFVFGAELYSNHAGARAAGLVVACVYVFAPYFIYDVYGRGGLAEIVAMAVLPWLLWSLRRIVLQQTAAAVILTALFSAFIVLAHSLTLALALPFLGGYVVCELSRPSVEKRFRALTQMVGAAILGAGLGAFYWFPYIGELPLVKAGTNMASAWETFLGHFISLFDLVQPAVLYQYEGPVSLGFVVTALGVLAFGMALLLGKRLAQRGPIFFFGAVAILSALSFTEPTRSVWQHIPAAAMIGFPWRFSLLTDLGLAMVIGSLPVTLPLLLAKLAARSSLSLPYPNAWRSAVVILVIGLVTVTSMARLSPKELDVPNGDLTLGQLARFEADTGFVGLTIWDEFFPTTIKAPIGYSDPTPIVNSKGSPADIRLVSFEPTQRTLAVSAREPTSVLLRTMYFPDWQATIDGVPTIAYASTPLGLLTVDVPTGHHRVTVFREDTLPRKIGTGLACVSLMILLVMTWLATRRRQPDAQWALLTLGTIVPVVLLPAGLALTASPTAPQPVDVQVGANLRMIGQSMEEARFIIGVWQMETVHSPLRLSVYWQVLERLPEDVFRWRLVDESGHVAYASELMSRYGTGFPKTWVPNEIVEDNYDLYLCSAVPPGLYRLEVAHGRAQLYTAVARIDLSRAMAVVPAERTVEHRIDAQVGDDIRLIGYAGPSVARAGQRVSVTSYWQSDRMVPRDYTTFIQLWDANGKRVAQHDSAPGVEVTSMLWPPGEMVPARHYLDLPADLKPGLYTLIGGMYAFPDLTRLPVITSDGPAEDSIAVLGQLKVSMPAPSARPSHWREISLGTSLRLLGYNLAVEDTTGKLVNAAGSDPLPWLKAQPGQRVRLELHWQALTRIETDYKVFVHLVDQQGSVAVQQDQMPGENQYPTHIWEAGETVVDSHTLPKLAPGRYRILVGLYSPETGERLLARDPSGAPLPNRAIEIGTIEVSPS